MNLKRLLTERLEAALAAVGADGAQAIVGPATRPEFGDYQANGAMAAAKRLRRKPQDLAGALIEAADLDGVASSAAVTGPGFISLTIDDDLLAQALTGPTIDSQPGQRVVIDYSHPNLAKEMQVHHLRSTIIGDAVARVLEALGHTVIRQNHIGDWGTQFGRLVAHLDDIGEDADRLADLESFYAQASKRFDDDADFADRARQAVVNLQNGDGATLGRWQRYIDISMSHCQAVYDALGVGLRPEHVRGESAYNADLDGIIQDPPRQGSAHRIRRRALRLPGPRLGEVRRPVQGQGRQFGAGHRAQVRRWLPLSLHRSCGAALPCGHAQSGTRPLHRRCTPGDAL